MEEFTPLPHPRRSFSSPVTGPIAAWKNQSQLGGQVLLFLARVAAVYCLALRRLRVSEWVYLEHGPTGLHPLVRRQLSSQLLHVLRLSPSQKRVKNGKDGSLWATFWRRYLTLTFRQPECCYNIPKGMCTKISTTLCQWGKNSSRRQLFQNSTQQC